MFDLDEIARGATTAVAGHRPSVEELNHRAQSRQWRRQRVAGGGAMLVFLVVVIGAWSFTGSPNATVDTANGRVADDGTLIEAFDPTTQVPSPWDVVVFMKADAGVEQAEEVRVLLGESAQVVDFTFVSKQQTYQEFIAYFSDDAERLDSIGIESMPPSFRVGIDDLEDPFLALLAEHAGVSTILGPNGALPNPIRVFGSPIFDRRGSDRLFLASRAGYDQAFRRCMADKGIESLEPLTATGWKPPEYLADIGVPLGMDEVSDIEFATKWGFAIALTADFVGPPPEFPEGISEDDPYYKAAFGGFFGGGCEAEVSEKWLDGDTAVSREWEDIVKARDAFASDQRVADHYADWSGCMAGRGYDGLASPLDAERRAEDAFIAVKRLERDERQADEDLEVEAGDQPADAQLIADERALAIATVECGGSSSNLVSLQLAQAWDEHTERGWNKGRYRANDPECLIEGRLVSTQLFEELANVDGQNADIEACFG